MRGNMVPVFEQARKTHKKVFVLITYSDCGKCSAFETFLNSQEPTVAILKRDYICYRADIKNPSEHKISEILKNPSYPFPYFFDADANLVTLGFPNSKSYDITDLSKIKIEENTFSELFQMDIGTKKYKDMVSMALKSELFFAKRNKVDSAKALGLLSSSLALGRYPYTVRSINLLAKSSQSGIMPIKFPDDYLPSGSDAFLYGNVWNYMLVNKKRDSVSASVNSRPVSYRFSDAGRDMGLLKKGKTYPFSFQLTNVDTLPLILLQVTHPCDCIKLEWDRSPLTKGKTTTIKGTFTPFESGLFVKEIFIHSNSKVQQMGIYKLHGSVE